MSIFERLRNGAREIDLPQDIRINGESIHCLQMLRLLPGKRATMKAKWRGREILLKLRPDTFAGGRGSRRELKIHRALRAAKIPTAELLFAARAAGAHALAFAYLQAAPMSEMWHSVPNRAQHLAVLVRFFRAMHARGFAQHDPHMNNFLWSGETIYAIDVASVKRHARRRYGAWQRRNLAELNAQIPRAWRALWPAALAAVYPEGARDTALAIAIRRARRRRQARYLKKCMRACGEFAALKNWQQVAVWRRAQAGAELNSFLRDPEEWMRRGQILKNGNSATVVRVNFGAQCVVIKRNNSNLRWGRWRRLFRSSRARGSWRGAHRLRLNDIQTPAPIAFLEQRWGPARIRGYYVCEYNAAPSANKFSNARPNEKELQQFAALFKKLRAAKISHGDMKASNFLVADDAVYLIDLESLKPCAVWRAPALLQKDRARFLKNWQAKTRELFAAALAYDK